MKLFTNSLKTIFLLKLLFFSSATVYAQNKFIIKGTVPSALNNTKLELTLWDNYSLNRYKKKDSIVIKNNTFIFFGELKRASEMAILTSNNGVRFFIIDSGMNELIIREIPKNSITKKNNLSNIEFVHSTSNLLQLKLDSLIYEKYLSQQKKGGKNSLELSRYYRIKALDVVKQFPTTYSSLIQLYSFSYAVLSLNPDEILDVYNSLNDHVRNSPLGVELYSRLINAQSVGTSRNMMEIEAESENGSFFTTNSLRGKNYLIAFGATWCKPCKENIPMLKNIYEKYHKKNFEILYVNLDTATNIWKKNIKDFNMNWINISEKKDWDKSDIVKRMAISAIPLYLIVDEKGIIVYNSQQSGLMNQRTLESVIGKLLKN